RKSGQPLSSARLYWFHLLRDGAPGPSATYTIGLSECPITEGYPAGQFLTVHYPSWWFVFAALIFMRQSRDTIAAAEKSLRETGSFILSGVLLTDQEVADLRSAYKV